MQKEGGAMGWLAALSIAIGAFWLGLDPLVKLLLWIMVAEGTLWTLHALVSWTRTRHEVFAYLSLKLGVLVVLSTLAAIDPHTFPYLHISLASASTIFYLVFELSNLTRDAHNLGIPLPPQLEQILNALKLGQEKKNGTQSS